MRINLKSQKKNIVVLEFPTSRECRETFKAFKNLYSFESERLNLMSLGKEMSILFNSTECARAFCLRVGRILNKRV